MIFALILSIFCLLVVVSCETASFYGDSYIHVPLQEARGTTSIKLQFCTKQSDPILLIAAGKTDYCFIKLEGGRIKVTINAGAGEGSLMSPKHIYFNDMKWHNVSVNRREGEIELIIDQNIKSKSRLHGTFFELNIDIGLYVGGQGDYTDLFFGHRNWLRGCVSDVMYNGLDPLSKAKKRLGQSRVSHVHWSCDPLLNATADTAISFVDKTSFMVVPLITSRDGSRWQLNIKTMSSNGVLLYVGGERDKSNDFVALIINEGYLKLLLDKGGGQMEVKHPKNISDGLWHLVGIQFSPSKAQISLDNSTVTVKLPQGVNRYYDLNQKIAVGGIDPESQSGVLPSSLSNLKGKFLGCIQGIKLSHSYIGLPNAEVTYGILANCVWEYSCTKNPCGSDTCTQYGAASYKCSSCSQHKCNSTVHIVDYNPDLQLMNVGDLLVQEGKDVPITDKIINVIIDYHHYKLNERDIKFNLAKADWPLNGKLMVNGFESHSTEFTLSDILSSKVKYVHSGNETESDQIHLLSQFTNPIPDDHPYFIGMYKIVIDVHIEKVNDAPFMFLQSNVVTTIKDGRVNLNAKVLNSTDIDSPRSQISYVILNSKGGYFEDHHPSQTPINVKQTYLDKNGIMYYVLKANKRNASVEFQVSDGESNSGSYYLEINTRPVEIKFFTFIKLVIVPYTSVSINESTIWYETNSMESINVLYKITKSCTYGVIEEYRNNAWYKTNQFTSAQLALNAIRYRHVMGQPNEDKFQFQATVNGVELDVKLSIFVHFIELKFVKKILSTVLLNKVDSVNIDESNIQFTTEPFNIPIDDIKFTLKFLPNFGFVKKFGKVLYVDDSFSQKDVQNKAISYTLLHQCCNNFTDMIVLNVASKRTKRKSKIELTVTYRSPKSCSRSNSNYALTISEGGNITLPLDVFDSKQKDAFTYIITSQPKHGTVLVVDSEKAIATPKFITLSEIQSKKVFYVHDNSESVSDFVQILAFPSKKNISMEIKNINITISQLNDNPPVQVASSPVRVITGGNTVLTKKHLLFHDADYNDRDDDLVYSFTNVSGLVSIYKQQLITRFKQKELIAGEIAIHDTTRSNATWGFKVSDGVHETSSTIKIYPSPSYVLVSCPIPFMVGHNRERIIDPQYIDVDTNMEQRLSEIRYTIESGPHQGVITLGQKSTNRFSQQDIINKLIVYQHTSTSMDDDTVYFKVTVGDKHTFGRLNITIVPTSYYDGIEMMCQPEISLVENTMARISRKNIQINHTKWQPHHIKYTIAVQPKAGYLDIEGSQFEFERSESNLVTEFDQTVLNSELLYYVHTKQKVYKDEMVLNITNGVSSKKLVRVQIKIHPKELKLQNTTVFIEPCKNSTLPSTIAVNGIHIQYFIVRRKPKRGILTNQNSDFELKLWTLNEFKSGKIQYVPNCKHENLNDDFILWAYSGYVRRYSILVNLVAKEYNVKPTVYLNDTLIIYRGSRTKITSDNISVRDDNDSKNLRYKLHSVSGGELVLCDSDKQIKDFTQEMINNKTVCIKHDGLHDFTLKVVLFDGSHIVGPVTLSTLVQDPILVVQTKPMLIFPKSTKPITSYFLKTICSDPSAEIYYKIKQQPKYGKLVMASNKDTEIKGFSQNDIDNVQVYFAQTAKTPLSLSNTVEDTFSFNAISKYSLIVHEYAFNILITPAAQGIEYLINTTTLAVKTEEGGNTTLNYDVTKIFEIFQSFNEFKKERVVCRLIRRPTHGQLCVDGNCNVSIFPGLRILSRSVIYQHDHTDTTSDYFTLSLTLDSTQIVLANLSFLVHVIQMNDQPFKLMTEPSVTQVVNGQEIIVSRNQLFTKDSDSAPQNILYQILSDVDQGRFKLGHTYTTSFTQFEINKHKVTYQHPGHGRDTVIEFRVWDGQFDPVFSYIKFSLVPAKLLINGTRPIYIQQGKHMSVITKNEVNIVTNLNERNVDLVVYSQPFYGEILVSGKKSSSFTLEQLASGHVVYKQTNMTAPYDTFEMNIMSGIEHHLDIQKVKLLIKVVPLLAQKVMVVTANRQLITTNILNATNLWGLSGKIPVYTLLSAPQNGVLKKIIFVTGNSSQFRQKEIMRFTQEDIMNHFVYYIANKVQEGGEERIPFQLEVSNNNIQVAIGELIVLGRGQTRYRSTILPPLVRLKDQETFKAGVFLAFPNMTDDYLLGITMLISTLVVSLAVVSIAKSSSTRYYHKYLKALAASECNTNSVVLDSNGSINNFQNPDTPENKIMNYPYGEDGANLDSSSVHKMGQPITKVGLTEEIIKNKLCSDYGRRIELKYYNNYK